MLEVDAGNNPTPRLTISRIVSMKERYPDKWQWKDDQEKNKRSFKQLLHVADLAVTQSHNIFLAHLVQHKDTDCECEDEHRNSSPLV